MSKQSLYKLYYANPELHKTEYEARFFDTDTIHLDMSIEEHPMFICQTAEVYKLIAMIERTDKRINALCSQLPGAALAQFARRCLVDEIVLTNNIEGVNSTKQEIGEILQDLAQKRTDERFVGLVRKYFLLMNGEDVSIKSCRDIRKIYDDIFYEEIKATDPGDLPDGEVFRKGSVSVYSHTQKEIHKGVMPETRVIALMEKALNFLNNTEYEPLIRIAVFHYLFGFIHPFYDANGRTSRFISSYLLSQELNALIGYRISYTIKENIKLYYEAFEVCNHPINKGDLTPFVEMFLNIVAISIKQLEEALQKRVVKLEKYLSFVTALPNGQREDMAKLYDVFVQAALFSEKGISLQELLTYMEASYTTVNGKIKQIPPGLLIKNIQGRKVFYMLNLKEVDRFIEMNF